MVSNQIMRETDGHNPELTSIKDFPNVLKRILLNTPYSISELEFEFALAWAKLKPLLDANSAYTTNENGEIIFTNTDSEFIVKTRRNKELSERKDRVRSELKKIYPITFFKRKRKTRRGNMKSRYDSIQISKFPEEHQALLNEAIQLGIIYTYQGMLILEDHYPPR